MQTVPFKQAYIQFNNTTPNNAEAMAAWEGLEYLNVHVRPFQKFDIALKTYKSLYDQVLFVGSTSCLISIFGSLRKSPIPLDYPDPLRQEKFLARSVGQQVTREAIEKFKQTRQPFFIKSVEPKLFTGTVIREDRQLAYLENFTSQMAWISQPVNFLSEWRCFVHNGKLIDTRPYQGDFTQSPDFQLVRAMIKAYSDAPVAFTLDVGILENGQTALVEVNDFWAIDGYGLAPEQYARLLMDRYQQIVR